MNYFALCCVYQLKDTILIEVRLSALLTTACPAVSHQFNQYKLLFQEASLV